jgi:tRNA(Ile)-lysidine synthase
VLRLVAETVERHRMFESGARVGVAVSGGPDSVCLLHVLRELAPRWSLSLAVLHLNHGLRGAESAADEEFVRALAGSLELPCFIRSAGAFRGNLEQAARRARQAFFAGAREALDLACVATGHTLSDQAETVLFRILRGSCAAGLAGILPVTREGIVRPLIEVRGEETRAYLRERGIAAREDTSNAADSFARNRIRRRLLPELEREWNPALAETLARTAHWARDEEVYWSDVIAARADALLHRGGGGVSMKVADVAAMPGAMARRFLRHAIEEVKGGLHGVGFEHVERVLDLLRRREGHGRVSLAGLTATRSLEWLRIAPPGRPAPYALALDVPGRARIPGDSRTLALESAGPAECGYTENVSLLDWGAVSGPLVLRSWRAGDRYRPAGKTAACKVKDLFQEARIPEWERGAWPVITRGGAIVWTRRFGAAAEFAARPDSGVVLKVSED